METMIGPFAEGGNRGRAWWRGLLCVLFCLVSTVFLGCRPTSTPTPAALLDRPLPSPDALTSAPPPAYLVVQVTPPGATVRVDGNAVGTTPLTLTLSPGLHVVEVSQEGFASRQWSRDLQAGERWAIEAALADVTAPVVTLRPSAEEVVAGQPVTLAASATDNDKVVRLELLIDGGTVAVPPGASLEYRWDTQGQAAGRHELLVRAYDAAGNEGQATATVVIVEPTIESPPATPVVLPTATPTVVPTSPSQAVNVYQTTLTIPTYPYADFLRERLDPATGIVVYYLDRAAYEAANPTPVPRSYPALVVENRYLSLTFLPELGGRLYSCRFRPTGQEIFYHNPVVKPSRWGPLSPQENWWLATGGMEWALPVHEHGYQFGIPWSYEVQRTSEGVTVVLRDSQTDDRLRAEVLVTLPVGAAYFTVRPRLVNPTPQAVRVQFWVNAMLTLGSPSITPQTEFIYPPGPVIVHSTGDPALPGERQTFTWPVHGGRDLSWYANWTNWLGFFVQQPGWDFVGAYNHATELGVVRLFSPAQAPGSKLFAFGPQFGDRGHYTDDGSQYFEIWGGPNRTFWPEDDITLEPGGSLSWTERWWPISGLGGLDHATDQGAVSLERDSGTLEVGLVTPREQSGTVTVLLDGQPLLSEAVSLGPAAPFRRRVALPGEASAQGRVTVRLTDRSGQVIFEYAQ